MTKHVLKAIPTNIITGFLGVGKTSAILNLLSLKPKNERWAVLVNEYGSMGIDGMILAKKGAFIEQVPGGCICCAQGLPFEVALNRLIKIAKPDRLIIEPSGLAHPDGVLKQLSKGYFSTLLQLKAVICLIDARYLSNSRYLSNEMFVNQMALADILLANKKDLLSEEKLQLFNAWVRRYEPEKVIAEQISQGEFSIEYLDINRNHRRKRVTEENYNFALASEKIESWNKIFPLTDVFELNGLIAYFNTQTFIRLKAIMKTDSGWFIFNQVDNQLTHFETTARNESKIEVLGVSQSLNLKNYLIQK